MRAFGYTLDPSVIDSEAVDFFTCGQCWSLAEAVSSLTGWPAVLELWDEDDSWKHVLVQMPDGRLLDIIGATDPVSNLFYVPLSETSYSFSDLASHCSGSYDWNPAYYRRRSLEIASLYAPAVIALAERPPTVVR